MNKFRNVQSSFTSGELDPRLIGRTDVKYYYNGAETLLNVFCLPQGGVFRRPGLVHRAALDDGAQGVRLIPFSFNTEQNYLLVFTHERLRVVMDGAVIHDMDAPWSGDQLAALNWTQSADTLLLVHPDKHPQRLRRQGSHTDWAFDDIPFEAIPDHDFGDGDEPVWSDARGWPVSVTFHDARLWLGGSPSRPQTLWGSKVGLFWTFTSTSTNDDDPLDVTADTDQVNAIRQLFSSRHLHLFTSGSEMPVTVDPPITPKNIRLAPVTRRGITDHVRPVEIDGAILFVQRGGQAIRQFVYDLTEENWVASPLSLLAPHLVNDPVEMAIRKGTAQDDLDYVLICNRDGSATILNTMRAQDVTAFSPMQTAGKLLRVAVVDDEIWFATERTDASGNPVFALEALDWSCLLDAAIKRTEASPVTTVSGLEHLEGQSVSVILDGAVQLDQTVTGGSLTLPRAATEIQIGRDFAVKIRTMPVERELPDGPIQGEIIRAHRARLRLHNSKGVLVNGLRPAFRQHGAILLDEPVHSQSGDYEVSGIPGYSHRAQLVITQDAPAPLTLLSVTTEVKA